MANIKPIARISKKWGTVTPQRAGEYKTGVMETQKDWSALTAGADEARRQGLAEADQRDAFVKGVSGVGTQGWKDAAVKKGSQRFGQGVQASVGKYERGFAPYHDVISGTELPPRGPKGSPQNYERVRAIGEAMRARKVQG